MADRAEVVIRLSSREWGDENRPLLVAVHGISGTAWDFHELGPAWASRWRVVAPDLPGFGLSAWDPYARYSVPDMVSALARFIGALGRPVVYVGHSIAGRMGILLADQHPELIQRLVLVDAAPGTGPGSPKVRQRVAAWPESGLRADIMAQYRTLYAGESDAAYQSRMEHYLEDLGDGRVRIRRDPAVKQAIFPKPASEGGPDFWGAWARLAKPVILVRGGRSQMLTSEIVERMCAEHADITVTTIAQSGHNVPAEAPAALAQIVQEQLQRGE